MGRSTLPASRPSSDTTAVTTYSPGSSAAMSSLVVADQCTDAGGRITSPEAETSGSPPDAFDTVNMTPGTGTSGAVGTTST
jgi:hypothetical protein